LVESISGHRQLPPTNRITRSAKPPNPQQTQFLVKWLKHKQKTWEPYQNVCHLLKDYYADWYLDNHPAAVDENEKVIAITRSSGAVVVPSLTSPAIRRSPRHRSSL